MREPSPEDMSYLSDDNIEWCCEHYFRERCKRDINAADDFLTRLEHLWEEENRLRKGLRPIPHRQSA